MLDHAAIRKAFAAYFADKVRLPEGTLPLRGRVGEGLWSVTYVLCEADGKPYLDFYASNRFTNDRHVRILDNGQIEYLDAPRDGFSYDDDVPGDRERAEREYFDHNRRAYDLLRSKGLL